MHKLAGVVVLLAAARLVDANAGPSLAECAAKLESEDADVAEVCPDIAADIASSPFADVALPDQEPSNADIDAFHRLTSAYAEPRAHAPDSAKLDVILAGLEVKKEPKSLWQLFNDWLADRWRELAKRFPSLRNPFGDLDWDWLDFGEIARSAGWGFLAMLVAFAVLGSGMLLQRMRLRRQSAAFAPSRGRDAGTARLPAFSELEHEPPAQRVRLLLQVVLAELRRAGRLIDHATLTHRQLSGAASGLDDSQRRALGNVADLAERVTYAHCEPSEAEADAVVEQGRLLVPAGAR
jgi:hypothetical protein